RERRPPESTMRRDTPVPISSGRRSVPAAPAPTQEHPASRPLCSTRLWLVHCARARIILLPAARLSMHRALATAIVTLATATAWAHPGSVSYANFSVDARSVPAGVRLPLDDVDLLLRIDRDLDGQVAAAEIDAANGAITAYIA